MNEPEFRKKISERMWKMEGLFAEAKQNHCLARAKYRGRPKVQIQAYLIAIVQNLKRLLFTLQINLFDGDLTNPIGGTLAPGPIGTGTTTITGNYTQQTGATLDIDIAGLAAGMFDVVTIEGNAFLAGAIDVTLAAPFGPTWETPLRFSKPLRQRKRPVRIGNRANVQRFDV